MKAPASAPVDEVNFDLETMKAAIQGPMTRMPDGVHREEFKAHMKASAESSALISDGVHDDTEGVRAALERKP